MFRNAVAMPTKIRTPWCAQAVSAARSTNRVQAAQSFCAPPAFASQEIALEFHRYLNRFETTYQSLATFDYSSGSIRQRRRSSFLDQRGLALQIQGGTITRHSCLSKVAGEVLHHHEGNAVDGVDVVDGGHVRVLEALAGADFL